MGKEIDYTIVKCNYTTEAGQLVQWTTSSLEDGTLMYRKALKKRARSDRPRSGSFGYEFGSKGQRDHVLPETDPRHREYCQLHV